MRRDEKAQLHVVEAVIVGIMVFTILFITAIFRIPTSPGTFQEAELEGIATDTLEALSAKPPDEDVADCNEVGTCPFTSEMERMLSLALGYEGPSTVGESRDTTELTEYLNQTLPPGTRYILSYSNGVNDTRVFPLNIVPPALDVSVGHLFLSPNWTTYSAGIGESVLIRINEITGFDSDLVTSIRDPLNRVEDEWGNTHLATFTNAAGDERVSTAAMYGTYRICAGACSNFTIVPPGIFGGGASILAGDRDNATGIVTKDWLHRLIRFNDGDNDNIMDSTEGFYMEFGGANGTVSVGDLRLSRVANCRGAGTPACQAGSFVDAGDTADLGLSIESFPNGYDKVRALDTTATKLEEGVPIYFDADLSGTVSLGDRRMTRYGTFAFGSVVAGSDPDFGLSLESGATGFSTLNVMYADTDEDLNVDAGEPVYLDLGGFGQSAGLESLDLHLSAKGAPAARFVYDLKLVVWFGV